MANFIIPEYLADIDPDVKDIIDLEAERQNRKLILIPSESSAPNAVRESLGSVLQNIYAEGYPDEFTRNLSEAEILDLESQILHFRRHSDQRYYKGVEFADILEELARKRCAELFANEHYSAEQIYVNVQPLSGAPANNAVYQALIEPGETVLGMNLFHGGHLTHGSSVNRSGKLYQVFHYSVDPDTERINYDRLRELAKETKPKIIIAGYSSYPWVPDWKAFSEISQEVGANLFADISHIAGLIAAGAVDSPVGLADVITFTTHKTLCGPRGACILSFDEKISRKIDRAVFPGEQGGPHVQVFAAMATTFKLAKSKQFSKFQEQVVKNCQALSNQLENRGIRIAYGGSNTHLTNIDCKSIVGDDGTTLSGDMAARVLDIAGMVTNANTIPGDKSTSRASGVRMGTPWVTQRGLNEKDMLDIADIVADILHAMKPYTLGNGSGSKSNAKIDFEALENAKLKVREITKKAIPSLAFKESGYPFYHFIDDLADSKEGEWSTFAISGDKARQSLNFLLPLRVESLRPNDPVKSTMYVHNRPFECWLTKIEEKEFQITINSRDAGLAAEWLRDLSDGFIIFDPDLSMRIPGPFLVHQIESKTPPKSGALAGDSLKPYYIGIHLSTQEAHPPLPNFIWEEKEETLKQTSLYQWHKEHGAKLIPFAGWEMPVWYSSVLEEHIATRTCAGLFDVTHMGVFQAEGVDAVSFLDSVCGNDIGALGVGDSCYTHFLDADAHVIDDLLVYRHDENKYMLVVNAANEDKDWSWLTAVKDGSIKVDPSYPYAQSYGRSCELKNLKSASSASEMRVDIALQGPRSREFLETLDMRPDDRKKIRGLKRTELCHINWEGRDLIVSRTGYTGEKMAFEIFVHPNNALSLWETLLKIGQADGLKPCGLGARDSLRTEAGLPLYGHELGGKFNLSVGDAGFGGYVKTYKPWFIGRRAFIHQEKTRKMEVARFQFEEKNVRLAHLGDLVLNTKGKIIGAVTSCAIDKEGYLTGQAYIQRSSNTVGNNVYIYQSANKVGTVSLEDLKPGDKVQLPSKATIISRFAKF